MNATKQMAALPDHFAASALCGWVKQHDEAVIRNVVNLDRLDEFAALVVKQLSEAAPGDILLDLAAEMLYEMEGAGLRELLEAVSRLQTGGRPSPTQAAILDCLDL